MWEAPIHQSHVYGRIKISRTIFEEGHQKNIPVKLFQNLTSSFREEDFFKNFFMSEKCGKPPFTRAMFLGGSKFCEQFLERVTQGTFLWNHFKIGPAVLEEKIFKELLKKFNFVAMATRVFDGIEFCEQFLNRTSQGTFLPSLSKLAQRFGRRCLKKLLTTHDARRTTDTSPP